MERLDGLRMKANVRCGKNGGEGVGITIVGLPRLKWQDRRWWFREVAGAGGRVGWNREQGVWLWTGGFHGRPRAWREQKQRKLNLTLRICAERWIARSDMIHGEEGGWVLVDARTGP